MVAMWGTSEQQRRSGRAASRRLHAILWKVLLSDAKIAEEEEDCLGRGGAGCDFVNHSQAIRR